MVVFPWRTTTLVFSIGFEHSCLLPILSLFHSACDLSMKPRPAMALYPMVLNRIVFFKRWGKQLHVLLNICRLQKRQKTSFLQVANQPSSTSFSNHDYLYKSKWLFLLNFLWWKLLSTQIHFHLLGTIRFTSRTKYRALSSGKGCILYIVMSWSFFFQPWL